MTDSWWETTITGGRSGRARRSRRWPGLERHIPDGEDFVDDEHVGVDVRGNGKSEARVHAGRVSLDGVSLKLGNPRKTPRWRELRHHIPTRHPRIARLEMDVLPPVRSGWKPRDLDQAPSGRRPDRAHSGFEHTGEQLKHGETCRHRWAR